MKSVMQWLLLLFRKYRKISVVYRYIVSVAIILIMSAAFVSNPQYWIVVGHFQWFFSGEVALDEPGWYDWRLLVLLEICSCAVLIRVFHRHAYAEALELISVWSFGWLVIPILISLWWLFSNIIYSFLNWECSLTFYVDYIASLLLVVAVSMLIFQVPFFIIALMMVIIEWRDM
jgi:hypothetical protein